MRGATLATLEFQKALHRDITNHTTHPRATPVESVARSIMIKAFPFERTRFSTGSHDHAAERLRLERVSEVEHVQLTIVPAHCQMWPVPITEVWQVDVLQ